MWRCVSGLCGGSHCADISFPAVGDRVCRMRLEVDPDTAVPSTEEEEEEEDEEEEDDTPIPLLPTPRQKLLQRPTLLRRSGSTTLGECHLLSSCVGYALAPPPQPLHRSPQLLPLHTHTQPHTTILCLHSANLDDPVHQLWGVERPRLLATYHLSSLPPLPWWERT